MSSSENSIEESKPEKRLEYTLSYGNIWLYVLSLIRKEKKIYAYALDDALESEFRFKPSKVMIYLVLYKLEGEKLIESHMEERRKYYQMTKKGGNALAFAKKKLNELAKKL
ncbi:MAG: PadR family transcriptional regulator [Candidatus Micrarchaeia archaeon]